jgi:hypothetical protein
MTPRPRHPDPAAWSQWIDDSVSTPDAAELERHLETCAGCRRLVGLLREVRTARRIARWDTPPESVVWPAMSRPAEPPPRLPRRARRADWQPLDVRSGGLGATGEARTASHALADGEVGIVAVPPGPEGRWRITGKVWRHGGPSGSADVVLAHADHVVAVTRTGAAGDFEMEEVVGPGWSLEIHFPDGPTVTLGEPGS